MPGPAALVPLGVGALNVVGSIMGNRARAAEAQKNRRFQERMRNTEWQAGMEDMKRAGINPALAYSQGGASSPSGSLAQQSDVISPGVSSAQEARRIEKELKLLDAQIYDVRASATQKGAQTALLGFQQGIASEDIKLRAQMFEMIGFDMVRARNMARAEGTGAGQKAALIAMLRRSIFGGGGAISPLRLGR